MAHAIKLVRVLPDVEHFDYNPTINGNFTKKQQDAGMRVAAIYSSP